MEKFVCYNPEFVFKCGQPIVDHFFFDHLKSVFFQFNNNNVSIFYIIKEFVQPKMSLNREFLILKERGRGVREREGGWAGQQAVIFMVSLGKVWERKRGETETQRDRERHRNKET
jgi:hypothetical protein